jgi:putative colanic acid biosynthesis UDP-glucose lipid carrier transferase
MDMHMSQSGVPTSSLKRSRRLLKNHETLMFWVQLFADVFVVTTTLYLLTLWKTDSFPPTYRLLGVITILSMFGIYSARGVYRRSATPWFALARITFAWSLCLACLLLVGFVTKTSDLYSRAVLILWAPTALVLQMINHVGLSELIRRYKQTHTEKLPTLVIGYGSIARHLVKSLNKNHWLPDRVIGLVQSDDEQLDKSLQATLPAPILGHVAALREIIKEHNIKRIYIALPLSESEQIEGLHIDLLDMNVDVIWAPDIFAMNLLNHSVREVAGVPLISLNESPLTSSKVAMFLKDMMDKTIAAIALLCLSPVFLAVAIAVKRSSPGPVFFKQDRHGFDGKIVKVWKFRSMKMHNDAEVVQQASKEDPRVTKVGKFIRRTSIDELPQLINVLQGSMSLVGPRPHAVSHNDYYSDKINAYLARHRIKPGITGLAQISGYRGETETLDKMEKRVEFDLAYINNWSLMLDLKILIKTPVSLLSKDIY